MVGLIWQMKREHLSVESMGLGSGPAAPHTISLSLTSLRTSAMAQTLHGVISKSEGLHTPGLGADQSSHKCLVLFLTLAKLVPIHSSQHSRTGACSNIHVLHPDLGCWQADRLLPQRSQKTSLQVNEAAQGAAHNGSAGSPPRLASFTPNMQLA